VKKLASARLNAVPTVADWLLTVPLNDTGVTAGAVPDTTTLIIVRLLLAEPQVYDLAVVLLPAVAGASATSMLKYVAELKRLITPAPVIVVERTSRSTAKSTSSESSPAAAAMGVDDIVVPAACEYDTALLFIGLLAA
jgi:hypothetical protein